MNDLIKREQSELAHYAERENGRMKSNDLIKREQRKFTYYAERENGRIKSNTWTV